MSWSEAKNPLTGVAERHSLVARIKEIAGFNQTEIKPYLKECSTCAGIFYSKLDYDNHIPFCVSIHKHLMTSIDFPYNTDLHNILKEHNDIFMQVICKPEKISVTIRKVDYRRFEIFIEGSLVEINIRGRELK